MAVLEGERTTYRDKRSLSLLQLIGCPERKAAYNMHVYIILPEEQKLIRPIFNRHQQVYEALVFQMPILHKHVQR